MKAVYDGTLPSRPAHPLYWTHSGRYQQLGEKLRKLIPASGPVADTRPALEKLRVAVNAYYELFNNGNTNGNPSFKRCFEVSSKRARELLIDGKALYQKEYPLELLAVEARMDAIILLAAVEHAAWSRGDL